LISINLKNNFPSEKLFHSFGKKYINTD